MQQKAAAQPSLAPAFLALLILGLFAFILFYDLKPSRTEHDINPPIEIIDEPLPLTTIESVEPIIDNEQLNKQEATAFVQQLATSSAEPVIIGEHNDQFIRHDGIISLPGFGEEALALKDLIQDASLPDDALLYLHRVTDKDGQGLWGIVQTGLINKFRQGLHIEGISPNKDMLKAIIPANADEVLPSGLSSFLGKILSNKVNNSYVYNLETKTMGRNANVIHPGQQLIMIHFTAEELRQVYQFFSEQRNQGIETFGING